MRFFRGLALLTVIATTVFVSGCKKKDDPKPEAQVQLENLSKSWGLSTVTLDGTTRTDFTNVVLTVTGSFNSQTPLGPYSYSFKGTFPQPSPWPQTGNWSFSDAATVSSVITRKPDDLQVNYSLANSGSTLILTLDYPSTGAGFAGGTFTRTEQVKGKWIFTFTAK